ncbi:MAG: thiol:disulfide interchange protein DsbA/DsbL [Chromatiales bacterium]|nr:thiol:disulfide interchange protein DsbA/DsbL [Chromatiales bacterium]
MQTKIATLLCVAMMTVSLQVMSADTFEAGKDYMVLDSKQPTSTGDKVEVLEFFSYGCPHCAHLEPVLQEWKQNSAPADVSIVRVPVAWNEGFETFARVYYAAEMAEASDEAHAAMFKLLHEDKPEQLNLQIVADTFGSQGVDADKFIQYFGSKEVTNRVMKAKELARRYKVTGVPTIFVDGTYEVPSPKGGNFPRMIQVVSYLSEEADGTP